MKRHLWWATAFWLWYAEVMAGQAMQYEYIVVMEPGSSVNNFALESGEEVLQRFPILNGALVKTRAGMSSLKRRGVAYVEPNFIVSVSAEQPNATWGIDRIDSRSGTDGKYYYSSTGAGVNVYVIDTGIFGSHNEFSGRMGQGYSVIAGGTTDCHGHGTHVAGTIAGTVYGVAKMATIYPVRVLGCDGSGTTAGVISGIEWVAANARLPAVANMSLGGPRSQATNDAVAKAIARNVTFAVAAGNFSDDACNYSPASAPAALTIAASDQNDVSASFTSYGRCVDLYAPGVFITSAGIANNSDATIMSGTSMASPHVAGVAALMLESSPSMTPAQLSSVMLGNASRGEINSIPPGTPNLLVYSNPAGPNPPGGVPIECRESYMCWVISGNLGPSSYHVQFPSVSEHLVVNYPRPIKIHTKADAEMDIYLYFSADGGQSWSEVARGISDGTEESITYQASSRGLYSWIVMLRYLGTSGAFTMWAVK